jgi:uncharacterized hydrophobic protein (TIGR00271 family)
MPEPAPEPAPGPDRTASPGTGITPARPPLPDARQSLGPALLDDLFPEGDAFRRSLQTFAALLALSALIATFGLYQDSVAAIIGAMVVAPLGGAIMALAGALVTGRIRWQAVTLLQITLGSLMVVAIAYGTSWFIPNPLTLNPSLDARTSPGLLDLGVALAAGAAGAWVAVRRTGTDALPGVAIAVSLVPPLATVGICLSLGLIDDAGGAVLLFLTNLCAILVVACIVFVFAGARPSMGDRREGRRLGIGFTIAMIALLVMAVPLTWDAQARITQLFRETQGGPIVEAWIGPRNLEVTSYRIGDHSLTLVVTGPDQPAPASELATQLARAFGAAVEVDLQYLPTSRDVAVGHPGS